MSVALGALLLIGAHKGDDMLKVFQHHIPLSALAELLADGVLCFMAVLFAAQGLSGVSFGIEPISSLPAAFLLHAAGFALMMSLLYSVFGLYRTSAVAVGWAALLGRAIMAVIVGAVIAYLVMRTEGPKVRATELLFPVVVYLVISVVLVRLVFHVVRRAVVGAPRVLVVGTGREAASVAEDLAKPGRANRSVVGFYPTNTDESHVRYGTVFDRSEPIDSLVKRLQVDEVIVAVREQRGGALPMNQLLDCRLRGTPVLDLAGFYERTRGMVPTESLKASWLVYGHGFVQGAVRTAIKRSFDVVCSSLLLVLASPVMLLTALVIKVDSPGPVIYRQERVGLRGRSFMCLKFRSMRTDAERDGVARWATKNDSRVTRVGAFIRKCRIDELPQLISVLRGDMSLVGPRPERPSFVSQLREQIPFYDIRHSVKPGVTGWAQVRYSYGASVEDARRKHEFDLYYVKNNSLFLDLLVLVETVSVVLFREGAQ